MKYAKTEGTVDGCHPNDLGFYSMAKALMDVASGTCDIAIVDYVTSIGSMVLPESTTRMLFGIDN